MRSGTALLWFVFSAVRSDLTNGVLSRPMPPPDQPVPATSGPDPARLGVEPLTSRNIVICCDGTGNQYGSANSNVVKLYWALSAQDKQIAYYHPGVGTMGARNALSVVGQVVDKSPGPRLRLRIFRQHR
jgi:hypothetical protein